MLSIQAIYQIKNGLNKLDSQDYQDIPLEKMQDAINSSTQRFVRRRLPRKETNNSIAEDIQILLKNTTLSGSKKDTYFLSQKTPPDYFGLSRITAIASKGSCTAKMGSQWVEDANVDEYLSDWALQPSWDFEQAFHILYGGRIKFYHGGDFDVSGIIMDYYRQPQYIQLPGAELPTGGEGTNMTWEWKDDVADQIIEESIWILAGNTGDYNRSSIAQSVITQP